MTDGTDNTETTRASAQVAQLSANLGAYTAAQKATMRAKWKDASAKLTAASASLKAARVHDRDAAGHMILGNGLHKLGVYNEMGMQHGSKWYFDQAKAEYDGAKADASSAADRVNEAKSLLDDVQAILGGN